MNLQNLNDLLVKISFFHPERDEGPLDHIGMHVLMVILMLFECYKEKEKAN
jgi:hypothetical protein